jgi:hypothetical protein
MLLFDRVIEHAVRERARLGKKRFGHYNNCRLTQLRRLPVYDFTEVAALFRGGYDEMTKSVPRLPPHEEMWAEWRTTANDSHGRPWGWEVGVSLMALPLDTVRPLIGSCAPEVREKMRVKPDEIQYACKTQAFRRITFAPPVDPALPENLPGDDYDAVRQVIGRVTVDPCMHLWPMAEDGRRTEGVFLNTSHSPLMLGLMGATDLHLQQFGFKDDGRGYYPDDPIMTPWPVFAAFALLHCRNITAEDVAPSADVQRRVERAGNPPRVTYKVLKIEVPRDAQLRRSRLAAAGDGPKVRFHLVSGHFKNLRNERYHRPGLYWWTEHHRGSRELGEVLTRRVLAGNGGVK